MWVFNEDGFFSVIEHKDNPDLLMVRSRQEQHLKAFLLRVYAGSHTLIDMGNKIIGPGDGDYAYRVICTKNVWAGYLVAYVDSSSIEKGVKEHWDEMGVEELKIAGRVWAATCDLESDEAWKARTKLRTKAFKPQL